MSVKTYEIPDRLRFEAMERIEDGIEELVLM